MVPGRFRLGVDFGTSNTAAVLQWPDGRSRSLLFDGVPVLPSAVYAGPSGLLVGMDALHSARVAPQALEPSPKRRIDDVSVLLGTHELTVVDLIAAVLARVALEAARNAGQPVQDVVLTYPASWGPRRREVLAQAAVRAGLGRPVLIAEPVAAATHFVRHMALPLGGVVVVYDFGAGTFDATVVRRTPAGFEVLASDGLPDAGGLDIDAAIVGYLGAAYASRDSAAWRRLTQPGTPEDRRAHRQLWEDVRHAKELLSRTSATQILLPLLNVEAPLGREQLDELARPVVDRTVATTLAVIGSVGLTGPALAGIYLVGGGSRLPLAATLLHRALRRAPSVIEQPELAVAEGSLFASPIWPTPGYSPQTSPMPAPLIAAPIPPAPVPTLPSLPLPAPVTPPAARTAGTPVAAPAIVPGPPTAIPVAAPTSQGPPTEPAVGRPTPLSGPPSSGPVSPPPPSDPTLPDPDQMPVDPVPPGDGGGRRRRWLVAGAAAVVAVAVLATVLVTLNALAGGPNRPGGPGSNAPTAATGYNAAIGAVVNPSATKGGTLRLVTAVAPDSLDPAVSYLAWVWNLSRLYLRTLMTAQPAPGSQGLKLVPDLAQQQVLSADGLTYTYQLRTGIRFQDGTPITSKDIKYGIERMFATELAGGPTELVDVLNQGQNYPGPYKDTDPNKLGLRSVQTPDDRTIVFRLAKPLGDFPYMLTLPGSAPVPQRNDDGAGYANHLVASGPYQIDSHLANGGLRLVRNPNWTPDTDPVRKALPDEVDLTVEPSDQSTVDKYILDGTGDLDAQQTGVTDADQAGITGNADRKKYADDVDTGGIRYLAVDTALHPFDNLHCRKAIEYAVDRIAVQNARGGQYHARVATNLLPPNVLGFEDTLDPYGVRDGRPQVDKARAELAACGSPAGFSTTIVCPDSAKHRATAQALQAALHQVSITAQITTLAIRDFYPQISSPAKVHQNGYGLILFGWSGDIPTPASALRLLVDGRSITPNANTNYAELNDPTINTLIDQAAAAADPAGWAQVHRKVLDTAALVPLVSDRVLNYRGPRLTNTYVSQFYGMLDIQALGVAAAH